MVWAGLGRVGLAVAAGEERRGFICSHAVVVVVVMYLSFFLSFFASKCP